MAKTTAEPGGPPPSAEASRPFRPLVGLAAIVSLIVLVLSVASLARHAQRFNEARGRKTFAYEQITLQEFAFAGRDVAILPTRIGAEPDAATSAENATDTNDASEPTLTLRYGDARATLPISIPPILPDLPGLLPHEDWLKVFRFVEATAVSKAEAMRRLEAGEERLVVVTRNLRPGADPQSWGQVWRRDWSFTFHELLPEGGLEVQKFDFPESKRSYDRRVHAARRDGLPDPERDPDELRQGTWEFEVALQVMPPGAGPSLLYEDNAIASAGWRLSLGVVSVMGLTVSLLWFFAPAGREAPTSSVERTG
ncbi:MAG: hypothetical protein AAGK04_13305 [Planctomycetota bacterium]